MMQDNDRYARQMLLPEIGAEGQEKLRRTRVLLVGAGGLGSPIALYLVGAGIGSLTIVDDDVVSVSNLHRQVLYGEDEVGQPKAECAARRLRRLNGEVQIQPIVARFTKENADMVAGYDAVIDGCDNFATRFLIDDACRHHAVPYIYGAICGLTGQASVFHYGASPRSYRDLFSEEALLQAPLPPKAVVGPTPGVVGSVEVHQALQVLAGYGAPLCGKLWTIDFSTMQTQTIEF